MQLNDGTTAKPLSLEYKEQGVRRILTDKGLMWYNTGKGWVPFKKAAKPKTETKTPKK